MAGFFVGRQVVIELSLTHMWKHDTIRCPPLLKVRSLSGPSMIYDFFLSHRRENKVVVASKPGLIVNVN